MIRNYLKIALRNIKRYPAHSILNISGMAIGMTCAILIILYVYDEWSYDRHFENAADLYRVIERNGTEGGSMMVPTPGALARTLKSEYPEIIRASRFIPGVPLTLKKDDIFIEEQVAVADSDFLKMFSIEFLQGDINTALNDPHNIIITAETAHKYFGDEDPLGKTITSRGYDVKITGVVKDLPHNSHFQFNFLVPLEWLTELGAHINDWNERFHTYIELKEGTDRKTTDQKIGGILKRHINGSQSELFLQNIKKIHLYSSGKFIYDVSGHGDITYVRILGIIAAFILLIACINYMNLSTAQSILRAKEIGLRKLAGAGKRKITFQFLGESVMLVFVAHIIAMILVELLLPGFNNLTGKNLTVNYQSAGLYIGLTCLILFCGLLAGSYPALFLSSRKPLEIIKGIIKNSPANAKFRRILVIFQFTMSVILIICTLTIGIQLRYLQNKDLGYNKHNVGYFMFPTRPGDPKLESLKKELDKNPQIISVTKGFSPVNIEGTMKGFNWAGKEEGNDISFCFVGADAEYATTFQLRLKQGRFFSPEISTDSFAIVINETAAEIMGFKNPVGEIITTPWGSRMTVLGVMKNFHFKSLHYPIEPLLLQIGASNNFFIRMKPDHIQSTFESVNATFKSFDPGIPIDFHFLDNDFDTLYRTERRIGKIFVYFSILAIFISCLGLIGLSSFITERRTKEIGLRKTNGAGTLEIFSLLSWEYIRWVILAILFACPVSWYAMNKWLENFAYRVNMPWWTFGAAGIIAFIIALLTVSLQSLKAARKNPVDALKYE